MSSDVTPRLLVTSPLFTGRFPGNVLLRAVNFATPKSAAEAQQTVTRLRREGFAGIKVIQDDGRLWTGSETVVPRLPANVFRALIQTAHREGMRVYAHVAQLADTRDAVELGADVLVHGTMDSTLSDALWGRMRERRIVWAPAIRIVAAGVDPAVYARRILGDRVLRETLSDVELARLTADTSGAAQPPDMPFPALGPNGSVLMRTLHENTGRARARRVTIAVGSDVGASGNGPGIGTHMEMELLQEAGLTPAEVMVAATYGGATAIGLQEKIGTIEPGRVADIVILSRNPLTDIRNSRAIEWVVKNGQPIRRSAIQIRQN